MSTRDDNRAAQAAKRDPLAALGVDDDHDDDDDECQNCHGDGRDPWNDYLLPCPMCQGDS